MIQHIYTEDTLNQNISFGIFNRRIFDNRKNLRDLSNHTVIIVTDEIIDNLSSTKSNQDFVNFMLKKMR